MCKNVHTVGINGLIIVCQPVTLGAFLRFHESEPDHTFITFYSDSVYINVKSSLQNHIKVLSPTIPMAVPLSMVYEETTKLCRIV